MFYTMVVQDAKKGDSWTETESDDEVVCQDTAQIRAEEVIENWNNTLRPHERPRKLLKVILEPADYEPPII